MTLLFVWVQQEFLLPRELRLNVFAGSLSGTQTDRIEFLQRLDRLGLAVVPIVLLLRLGIAALFLQLGVLLHGTEIKLQTAFRTATVAYGAVLFSLLLQGVFFLKLGSSLRAEDLATFPDTLTHILGMSAFTNPIAYALAAELSISTLMWIAMCGYVLTIGHRCTRGVAIRSSVFAAVVISLLRAGASIAGAVVLG